MSNQIIYDMRLVDLIRADIQEYLEKKDGELLFNERDLQMHLAHHLIGTGHYDDVDVEYYVPYEELDAQGYGEYKALFD